MGTRYVTAVHFLIELILPAILRSWGSTQDSASNRHEYQECIVRGKGDRCVGLTALPLSCADCLEIPGATTSRNRKGLSRRVM